jgi:uncharacterized protein YqeY
LIHKYREDIEEVKKNMNEHMGDKKSYAFLKAPTEFIKQLTEVVEIFLHNAHKNLLKKIGDEDQLLKQFYPNMKQDDE